MDLEDTFPLVDAINDLRNAIRERPVPALTGMAITPFTANLVDYDATQRGTDECMVIGVVQEAPEPGESPFYKWLAILDDDGEISPFVIDAVKGPLPYLDSNRT